MCIEYIDRGKRSIGCLLLEFHVSNALNAFGLGKNKK